VTDRAARLPQDRQTRLFDLYDSARAAENQVVWASSNQTGTMGSLRFLGQAKVVGPGGDVLARTSAKGGLAVVSIDVGAEIARARRVLHHLAELEAMAYR
jgi:nitrilase